MAVEITRDDATIRKLVHRLTPLRATHTSSRIYTYMIQRLPRLSPRKRAAPIVDEDPGIANVMGMNALDGQIVRERLAGRPLLEPRNGDDLAVGAEDPFVRSELIGSFEALVGDGPERVVLGGRDDLAVDD